jgi:tetratricopeptide (TPR) repeat protein
MKKALLYLVILLMTFGCQHHYQYPPILQEADSLCVALPDSAVVLLKSISDDMRQETEHIQMRYKLLTIKANDKAYINHTSDSLILSLVDYYEHGGDPAFLGEAYYYAGSTYRDLGDAPRALEYYQKALDAMPGNENLKVKSKVYAQMGQLFILQKLYRKAFVSYKNAYQSNSVQKDTVGMIYNLRDMGFAYRGLDKPDSTLLLLNQAHELALDIKNELMDNSITSQMASLYIRLDDLQKAKEYIQPSLKRLNRNNLSSVLSIAGDIYYKLGQVDSAAYYYQSLLNVGTIYAKRDAYYNLANIAQLIWKDSKKVLNYTNQYKHLQDSINDITATESIAQMSSLYNYQLRERENAKLQIQRQNYYILFISASIIVVVLLSIGFFFVRWYFNRRKQYRETLNHILAEVYRKTDAYIEEKKLEIEEAERILGDLSYDNVLERNHQEHRRESLRLEMERAKEEQEMQKQRNIEIMNSEIQDILKSHVNNGSNMKTEDWSLAEQTLEHTFPGYTERLKELSGMTEIKYKVCLLTKLQQRNSDIAVLVNRTPSAITRLKERFLNDLGIADTSNISFDSFISSL